MHLKTWTVLERKGTSEGTGQTCSFTQYTLTVSDVAAGTIKLVSGISVTVLFLKVVRRLDDSFWIHAQTAARAEVSLQCKML